jgi:glycosyltransferase involved in cell wall biosynthesis
VRVLAWVPQPFDTSPGQRFRIEQWDPHLRARGIDITYSPFASPELTTLLSLPGHVGAKALGVLRALTRRVAESRAAAKYDLLYVFREGALAGPALAERLVLRSGLPMVFDFDDAVWIRYVSPSNSYLSYLRCPGKTATLSRLARHVLAGNDYLKSYAERFNSSVSVVPTTVDTKRFAPPAARPGQRPVIGWTGSFSTSRYLQLIKPALERLRRSHDFRFVVVGGAGFHAEGVDVEDRPWRSATEVQDLLDFNIGVMPLPDTEWERGKCGFKALVYMALGISAVASPVGVNSEIVQHGVNGLLASSPEEWESALGRLLADAELRRRLGQAGRATVESRYATSIHAPRVAAIFEAAVSSRSEVRSMEA